MEETDTRRRAEFRHASLTAKPVKSKSRFIGVTSLATPIT
jgi:hypothetical protein